MGDDCNNIILKALTGSHSLGLNSEGSDVDIRFIWIATLRKILSIRPPKEFIVRIDGQDDVVGDEIGRFMYLAGYKGNPERISMLSSPIQDIIHPVWGKMLIDNKQSFLSMKVLRSMYGFAGNQLRHGHGIRGTEKSTRKAIMHNIRLSWQGIELSKTGQLIVEMPEPFRSELMAVKNGDIKKDTALALANEMMVSLQKEINKNTLPPEADMDILNDILYAIRMGMKS